MTGPEYLYTNDPDPALQRLAEAAEAQMSISAANAEMRNYAGGYSESDRVATADLAGNPELLRIVSLGDQWVGPIEPLMTELSALIGWGDPVVLNRRPSNDVIVSVGTRYRRAVDIFQDAGVQTGSRAHVELNLEEERVYVTYAD